MKLICWFCCFWIWCRCWINAADFVVVAAVAAAPFVDIFVVVDVNNVVVYGVDTYWDVDADVGVHNDDYDTGVVASADYIDNDDDDDHNDDGNLNVFPEIAKAVKSSANVDRFRRSVLPTCQYMIDYYARY